MGCNHVKPFSYIFSGGLIKQIEDLWGKMSWKLKYERDCANLQRTRIKVLCEYDIVRV